MKIKKRWAVTALLLVPGVALAAESYVTNAAEIVKAADWNAMETVNIVVKEHSYSPEAVTLKANRPYRLVIRNEGKKKHYFTAENFYRTIATRKGQTRDAEFKAPYFSAIEVVNGGTAELYFVPVAKGTYEVICTIDDHREQGMEGTITVE